MERRKMRDAKKAKHNNLNNPANLKLRNATE